MPKPLQGQLTISKSRSTCKTLVRIPQPDLRKSEEGFREPCIEIFSMEGFTPCIYVAVIIDMEYVACIYIDWLSTYFLRRSIHRNFQHRILQSISAGEFPRAKKIFLWYIETLLRGKKKHSRGPCIEISRIYPAIWLNLAQIWSKYAKNGKHLTKKCRVWNFSISISS